MSLDEQRIDTVIPSENESATPAAANIPIQESPSIPVADSQEAYYKALKQIEDEKRAKAKEKLKKVGIVCLALIIVIAVVVAMVLIVRNVRKNSLTDYQKTAVNTMISSIEELPDDVSLSNETKIGALLSTYSKLTEKQQKKVKNHKKLERADKAIDMLKIAEVEEAIEGIGTVTADSGDAISKANKLYIAISDDLKKQVKSSGSIAKAQAEYDKLCSDRVIQLIKGIGAVSLTSKDSLDEIDKYYGLLSDSGKKLVTNYGVFTDAKEKYNKIVADEKKKALKAALSKFKSERDDIEGCTWYYCSTEPHYINDRSYFLPYLRYNDDGTLYMFIKAVCVNDEWIFWNNYKFVVDGETYTKSFNYFELERDNNSKNLWEYANYSCTSDDVDLLRAIANSNKAVIRFRGDAYYKDVTISAADKAAIKVMLNAYDIYNG